MQQHQVHVKNLAALGPQGLYHLGAHAQVGDKVPIHDVNMDRFRLLDPPQLFPRGGKIRCQQRGAIIVIAIPSFPLAAFIVHGAAAFFNRTAPFSPFLTRNAALQGLFSIFQKSPLNGERGRP